MNQSLPVVGTDPDAWDDSALLKAYDDALKGIQRRPTKRQRSSKANGHNNVVQDEEEEEGEVSMRNPAIGKPMPSVQEAPGLDNHQVSDELKALLQAYFDAGYALARYVQNQQLEATDDRKEDDTE